MLTPSKAATTLHFLSKTSPLFSSQTPKAILTSHPLRLNPAATITPLSTSPLAVSTPISRSPLTMNLSENTPESSIWTCQYLGFCFALDLAVDLLLKSSANPYLEFKNIDASFIGDGNGNLLNVPDSKSAVFKDRTLKYSEKNQLNCFFKLVQGHLEAVNGVTVGEDDDAKRISNEDLESPFVDFLDKMRLRPKIKSIILYAIDMVDYDQDGGEACKDILRTKDGIDRLALYYSSVGRS